MKDKYLIGITSNNKKEFFNVKRDNVIAIKDCFFELSKDEYEDATEYDTSIEFFCFFDLYFKSDDDEDKYYVYHVKLPYNLRVHFDSKEIGPKGEQRFFINAGSEIFESTHHRQSVLNAYSFFSNVIRGGFETKLNANYLDLFNAFYSYLENNEIGGHTSLELELLYQGICRDKNNPEIPFRWIANKNNLNDFITINIREIPRYESSFNAIASENIMKGLTKTIVTNGGMKILTPLEQIALGKTDEEKNDD
jgi:hypothetical protein